MTQIKSSNHHWWHRLWRLLVPPTPDFFAMLEAQADNLRATLDALVDYLASCNADLADRVHDLVEKGHTQRDNNLQQLYRSFITPIDREDIYTLAMAIDHILDYIKNTVREVEVLQVEVSKRMQLMGTELADGAATLSQGLARLRAGQAEDVAKIVKTRQAERRIEDVYREALGDMFQGEEYQLLTEGAEPPEVRACLDFLVVRIKRREVYRHLSNAADRLAHAGEALRDISIKYDSGVKR
jgi:X-X-X-Leu-X-X-Gly heptad repeat protein